MKIGIIQQANTTDRNENVSRLQSKIRDLVSKGADLIVLQELHNGLYFCQTEETGIFDQAETIPGPSTHSFGQLAKELGVVILLSLFERNVYFHFFAGTDIFDCNFITRFAFAERISQIV